MPNLVKKRRRVVVGRPNQWIYDRYYDMELQEDAILAKIWGIEEQIKYLIKNRQYQTSLPQLYDGLEPLVSDGSIITGWPGAALDQSSSAPPGRPIFSTLADLELNKLIYVVLSPSKRGLVNKEGQINGLGKEEPAIGDYESFSVALPEAEIQTWLANLERELCPGSIEQIQNTLNSLDKEYSKGTIQEGDYNKKKYAAERRKHFKELFNGISLLREECEAGKISNQEYVERITPIWEDILEFVRTKQLKEIKKAREAIEKSNGVIDELIPKLQLELEQLQQELSRLGDMKAFWEQSVIGLVKAGYDLVMVDPDNTRRYVWLYRIEPTGDANNPEMVHIMRMNNDFTFSEFRGYGSLPDAYILSIYANDNLAINKALREGYVNIRAGLNLHRGADGLADLTGHRAELIHPEKGTKIIVGYGEYIHPNLVEEEKASWSEINKAKKLRDSNGQSGGILSAGKNLLSKADKALTSMGI